MHITFVNLSKFVSRKVTITVIYCIDLVVLMIYNCTINRGKEVVVLARKIRIISLCALLLILAATFTALYIVDSTKVDTVSSLKVAEEGKTDNCTLQWKHVSGADGYKIYVFDEEKNDFIQLVSVDNGKTTKQVIKELTPSTVYRFKISAFKLFMGQEYDGELSHEITAYTAPSQPEIEVRSAAPGNMTVEWKADASADYYQLEYDKSDGFSNDTTESKDVPSKRNSAVIDSLEEKQTYYVRVRGCLQVNGDDVFGEWSDVKNVKINETQRMTGIDKDKPMVALTFDDGPAFNGATERILDTLEKYGARATFFMVGSRINDSTKEYLKREIELGCELGNHTYDHSNYGKKVTASDVSKCSDAIYKAVGEYPTAFRCPGGIISKTMRHEAKKEGMVIAYWSVDTEDWKSKNAAKILSAAKSHVYDGSIILMHDIYSTTADAVEKLVPYLVEEGYQIVTVSELIQAKTGKAPEAGEQYVDAKTINNNT